MVQLLEHRETTVDEGGMCTKGYVVIRTQTS
jgi:hypothetical protein